MTDHTPPSVADLVRAPFDETLQPQQRTAICIQLSELMVRIATHIVCHTLVDYQDLLDHERLSVAHAFVQRVTTTHLCNHKLTAEGLVLEYQGQPFELHEEYKTMMLTRSVYEHLAMFYFLYQHPRTVGERDIVWRYWKINSKKNLLSDEDHDNPLRQRLVADIEQLRTEILTSPIGQQCHKKLDEWTSLTCRPSNGSLEFTGKTGHYDVRRLNYSQAWRYLFGNSDLEPFYRQLSLHCHPVYHGLLQFQEQATDDQGSDGIPLYFSCRFLARLCHLFLKLLPDHSQLLHGAFTPREQQLFHALADIEAQ